MKLYKGTSSRNKSLVYVSMDRQEEKTITRVLTRLLRKVEVMTGTEQDTLKDLLRGFVFEGKSMTENQFSNISELTSEYRIRFALEIEDEKIADSMDQWGQAPAKRRLGIMEKELRAKKYQGKWTKESVSDFLAEPSQQELEAIGMPVLQFFERLTQMVDEQCDEACQKAVEDIEKKTIDLIYKLERSVKVYSDIVLDVKRELRTTKEKHKQELEYLSDCYDKSLEKKFSKFQEEAEETITEMFIEQHEKFMGTEPSNASCANRSH